MRDPNEKNYVWIKMDPSCWWCNVVSEWRTQHPEFDIKRPGEIMVSRYCRRIQHHSHAS